MRISDLTIEKHRERTVLPKQMTLTFLLLNLDDTIVSTAIDAARNKGIYVRRLLRTSRNILCVSLNINVFTDQKWLTGFRQKRAGIGKIAFLCDYLLVTSGNKN